MKRWSATVVENRVMFEEKILRGLVPLDNGTWISIDEAVALSRREKRGEMFEKVGLVSKKETRDEEIQSDPLPFAEKVEDTHAFDKRIVTESKIEDTSHMHDTRIFSMNANDAKLLPTDQDQSDEDFSEVSDAFCKMMDNLASEGKEYVESTSLSVESAEIDTEITQIPEEVIPAEIVKEEPVIIAPVKNTKPEIEKEPVPALDDFVLPELNIDEILQEADSIISSTPIVNESEDSKEPLFNNDFAGSSVVVEDDSPEPKSSEPDDDTNEWDRAHKSSSMTRNIILGAIAFCSAIGAAAYFYFK